jgi:hypothetical protein
MASKRPQQVTIQRTTGVTLRVTVEVRRAVAGMWEVRWLHVVALSATRATAVARAIEVCGAMHSVGIHSEIIIRRVNGTIGERRTYGDDPRRSRG